MSPSERASPSVQVPPEVLAIAVALVAEWQAAEAATNEAEPEPPSRWRLAGRQWERRVGHRWS